MGYHIGPAQRATPLWFAISLIFTVAFSLTAQAASSEISQVNITSSPQDINKNTFSTPITVEFKNATGTKETLDVSGARLELTTPSTTGTFYTSTTASAPLTIAELSGEWSAKTIYYKDSTPGTHHLQFALQGDNLKEDLVASQDIHINETDATQPIVAESAPDILSLAIPSVTEGAAFTIRGKLDSAIDTTVLLRNRSDPLKAYDAVIHPDNTFSYELSSGLPKGEYIFEAVAKRKYMTSQVFIRKVVVEEASSPAPVVTPTAPEAPAPPPVSPSVKPPESQLISLLSVEPVPLLSTTFATPLVSPGALLRVSDPLNTRTLLAAQSSVLRSSNIIPPTQRELLSDNPERILPLPNLKTNQESTSSTSALKPTQSGWHLFGISWQWWAGGVAAALAGWWAYRSLRKIA